MISTLVSYGIIPTIRRHGSHVTADEVIRRRRRLRLRLDHIRLRIWNASTWSDRGHRCQAATARSAGADDGAAGVRQGSDTCRTTAERATPTAVAWVVVALQRLHCGPHTNNTPSFKIFLVQTITDCPQCYSTPSPATVPQQLTQVRPRFYPFGELMPQMSSASCYTSSKV